MLPADRRIDVTVFGATGFTGKLVCQHLKQRYWDRLCPPDRLSLALAARSRSKLEGLVAQLGFRQGDVELFVADSSDEAALGRMCGQTRVVVSLVGPYALYGDALVGACVEHGTHYLDLTGETYWVSRQITRLQARARRNQTILVPSCGFDSVPSDLNAMLAVRELKRVGGGGVQAGVVTSGVRMTAGISGGTLASLLVMFEQNLSEMRKAMYCYALSPVKGIQRQSTRWVFREVGLSGGFFVMALPNGAMVRRSWGLLESAPDEDVRKAGYGNRFTYDEFIVTRGVLMGFLVSLMTGLMFLLLFLPPVRALVRKYGPKSGQGPSEKVRKAGWFQLITTAHSVKDDVQVRVTMHGTRDPGYGWTSISIAECAVALIKNHEELPPLAKGGGFLTPATAFGDILLKRLEAVEAVKIKKEVLKNGKKTT